MNRFLYWLLAVPAMIWCAILSVVNAINYIVLTYHLFGDLGWLSLVLIINPLAWLWIGQVFLFVGSAFQFLAVWKAGREWQERLMTLVFIVIFPLILYAMLKWIGPYFYPICPTKEGHLTIRFIPILGGKGYNP